MKRIISYILTVLLSMGTLTACGMLPHEGKGLPERGNVQAPIESPDPSGWSNAQAQQRVRQLLGEQDYIGTINLIRDEVSKGADEQILAEEYLQAANGSLSQAETLLKQGHFSRAALLLKTVQESSPLYPALQQRVATSPVQLADKIQLCTEKLMEEGLIAYRSGGFASAIDSWQQILKFNPQHQAARDSIQTTQLQMAKLKTLNSKD